MSKSVIYLDNQSTTRVDAAVVAVMEPLWEIEFANPASASHSSGRQAAELVDQSAFSLASLIGGQSHEIVWTSGATESNNLAIFGTCLHQRQKRRRVIALSTEHRAVLDPMRRLERFGFQVDRLPVLPNGHPLAGQVELERLEDAMSDQVALVSVMLANNEVGVIQPLAEVASICRRWGAWLHTDATQAIGKMAVDVDRLGVDLMSFSGHKFYGPKGIGGLWVRQRERMVRLDPQILGGGHQANRRSGTLNVPGIVGMTRAIEICMERGFDGDHCRSLRDSLWRQLKSRIPDAVLNGPALEDPALRLPGNLNCEFPGVEGQSLMLAVPELAVSSGSACTSAEPEPSHVLGGLGLSDDQSRCSLRFGVGRFNRAEEIDLAAKWLGEAYHGLVNKL